MCKVLDKASYCCQSDASKAPCYYCASQICLSGDTVLTAVSFFVIYSAIFLKTILDRIIGIKEKIY